MTNTEVISLESLVREISPKKDADCLRRLTLLLRKYKRRGPVILHTHSSKAGILGRIAGQLAGIKPIIHSIHGFSFHEGQKFVLNKTYVAAEIATGKRTDGFIGVSQANLDEATKKGIIKPYHRIALVRSGFDINDFYEQAAIQPRMFDRIRNSRRSRTYRYDRESKAAKRSAHDGTCGSRTTETKAKSRHLVCGRWPITV